MKKLLNNFTSGEWTPLLDGRIDYERYDTACRKMENFTVLPYGGAQFRPGFEYAGYSESHSSPRLVPFVFSNEQKFILEFIRVRDLPTGGIAPAASGGSGYKTCISIFGADGGFITRLDTVYGDSDFFRIQYKQINDVIFFTHPDHPVQKLMRDVDGWKISELLFDNPPMLDENTDEESSMWFFRDQAPIESPTKASTGRLTANKFAFNQSHIGAYFELNYKNEADFITINIPALATAQYFVRHIISASWGQPVHYQPARWVIRWSGWNLISASVYNSLLDSGSESGNIWNDAWGQDKNKVPDTSMFQLKSTSDGGLPEESSNSFFVRGDWQVSTTGHWWGLLEVQRSMDGGLTWRTVRKFESRSDRNVSASGTEPDICLMRLHYTSLGSSFDPEVWTPPIPDSYAKPTARLEFSDAYVSGVVRVTGIVDESGSSVASSNTAIVSVVRDLIRDGLVEDQDNSTDLWREGAWSHYRGFPSAIGMYEQRLFFANTRDKPNTIWASASDDFENFKYGTGDGDAFAITLAATEQNGVAWIESLRRLHTATASRNFSIRGGDSDGTPISATNLLIQSENMFGAAPVTPEFMNDAIIYVARKGRRIHEMAYSIERDAFLANDISLLATHMLESGVRQIAYYANPDSRFFCVCNDGTLAVFTYLPNEQVSAWSRWKIGGAGRRIESVCVLPGDEFDALYAVVGEESGNSYTIVKLSPYSDKKADGQFLDMATVITEGLDPDGATVDMGYFANGTVLDCVVDGRHLRNCTYANRRLTFSESVPNPKRCVAGLPYAGEIESMRTDGILQSGPTAGSMRRVKNVTARFHSTVSCKAGRGDDMQDVDFRNTHDRMDDTNPEFTGDVPIAWPMGHDREARVRIVQDAPFPCTIIALSLDWEVFGG